MLNFLAKTENLRKRRSEQPIYNRGNVLEKSAGNCYCDIRPEWTKMQIQHVRVFNSEPSELTVLSD